MDDQHHRRITEDSEKTEVVWPRNEARRRLHRKKDEMVPPGRRMRGRPKQRWTVSTETREPANDERWSPWQNWLEENCVCRSDPTTKWERLEEEDSDSSTASTWPQIDDENITYMPMYVIPSVMSLHMFYIPSKINVLLSGNNGQIQLWQFLLEMLTDKDYQASYNSGVVSYVRVVTHRIHYFTAVAMFAIMNGPAPVYLVNMFTQTNSVDDYNIRGGTNIRAKTYNLSIGQRIFAYKKPRLLWKWVGGSRSHSEFLFFGKSSRTSPKPVGPTDILE